MADFVDPDSTAPASEPRSAPKARPTGRLTFGVGFEELGQSSFTALFIMVAALVVSPLGGTAPVAILSGLLVIVLGGQMVMRRPHLIVPESARQFVLGNAALQTVLKFGLRWHQSANRRPPHWITTEPFDVVPKLLLIVCGVLLLPSWTIPYMPQLLGLAILLLALSPYSHKPYLVIGGACMFSLATITPLFSG